MECAICEKDSSQAELYEGVYDAEILTICEDCAEDEGIPLIKKPNEEQIETAQKSLSVRERLDKMSGVRKTTPISADQEVVQGHIARLKMPERKQMHEDLREDYYWQVNMARRRKKMSINQLANEVEILPEIIEQIEKGQIPKDFETIFEKLEVYFGIKLLKKRKPTVSFVRTQDEEDALLESVRRKMEGKEEVVDEDDITEEELATMGVDEIDFSNRNSIKDVTLSQLIDKKRAREKKAKEKKKAKQEQDMLGEDVELDLE